MSSEYVQVINAKDFLNYLITRITKDKEVKKAILAKYTDIFTQNISAVLDSPDKADCEVIHFKLADSKLYFNIRHNDVYTLHSEEVMSSEVIKHLGHPLFNLFVSDLKSIVFKEGYKYIAYVLGTILAAMGPKAKGLLDDSQIEAFVLSLGEGHGESVNNLIIKIGHYGKMLDGVNGFTLKEWDDKRATVDASVLQMVCQNTGDFREFLFKYIETLVVLMTRSVVELEGMIEKAKIKYN